MVKDCSKQGKEMDIRDIHHIGDEVVFTCKCQDLDDGRNSQENNEVRSLGICGIK